MSSQMPAVLALTAELAVASGSVHASSASPTFSDVPATQALPSEPRVWRSADLFGSDTVVWIEHQGAQYQLRTTRQGKLILTK